MSPSYFLCEFPYEEVTDKENAASRPVNITFSEWALDPIPDVTACIKKKTEVRVKYPSCGVAPREVFARGKEANITWTECIATILAESADWTEIRNKEKSFIETGSCDDKRSRRRPNKSNNQGPLVKRARVTKDSKQPLVLKAQSVSAITDKAKLHLNEKLKLTELTDEEDSEVNLNKTSAEDVRKHKHKVKCREYNGYDSESEDDELLSIKSSKEALFDRICMQKAEIGRLKRRLKEKELLELSIKDAAIAVDKLSGLKKEIDILTRNVNNVNSKVSEKTTTVATEPKKDDSKGSERSVLETKLVAEVTTKNAAGPEKVVLKPKLEAEATVKNAVTDEVLLGDSKSNAEATIQTTYQPEDHDHDLQASEQKLQDLAKDIKIPMVKKKSASTEKATKRLFSRNGPIFENPDMKIMFGTRELPASRVQKIRHNTRISTVGGDLFEALYTPEERAFGNLTGKSSNAHKKYIPKKILEPEPINGIIDYLFEFGQNTVTREEVEAEVRSGIGNRLCNFLKKPECSAIQAKVQPVTKAPKPVL